MLGTGGACPRPTGPTQTAGLPARSTIAEAPPRLPGRAMRTAGRRKAPPATLRPARRGRAGLAQRQARCPRQPALGRTASLPARPPLRLEAGRSFRPRPGHRAPSRPPGSLPQGARGSKRHPRLCCSAAAERGTAPRSGHTGGCRSSEPSRAARRGLATLRAPRREGRSVARGRPATARAQVLCLPRGARGTVGGWPTQEARSELHRLYRRGQVCPARGVPLLTPAGRSCGEVGTAQLERLLRCLRRPWPRSPRQWASSPGHRSGAGARRHLAPPTDRTGLAIGRPVGGGATPLASTAVVESAAPRLRGGLPPGPTAGTRTQQGGIRGPHLLAGTPKGAVARALAPGPPAAARQAQAAAAAAPWAGRRQTHAQGRHLPSTPAAIGQRRAP